MGVGAGDRAMIVPRGLDAAALEVGEAIDHAAPAFDQEDRELAVTDGFGLCRREPADHLSRHLEVPLEARDQWRDPRAGGHDDLFGHHLFI